MSDQGDGAGAAAAAAAAAPPMQGVTPPFTNCPDTMYPFYKAFGEGLERFRERDIELICSKTSARYERRVVERAETISHALGHFVHADVQQVVEPIAGHEDASDFLVNMMDAIRNLTDSQKDEPRRHLCLI